MYKYRGVSNKNIWKSNNSSALFSHKIYEVSTIKK